MNGSESTRQRLTQRMIVELIWREICAANGNLWQRRVTVSEMSIHFAVMLTVSSYLPDELMK